MWRTHPYGVCVIWNRWVQAGLIMDDESELETALKVVAIMQTVAEDLDESSKKMWRKMLGISDKPKKSPKNSKPSTSTPE